MLIPAARRSSLGRPTSQTASLPAPTGGWNARDALSQMEADDAIQMDNYIPGTAYAYLRPGSLHFAYYVGQLTAFSRSTSATYFDSTGTLQTASTNTPRYSYYSPSLASYALPQLVIESGHTNYALWCRDLTNAVWSKNNVTATKNAIGIDGNSNAATTISATSNNGTITQAITAASGLKLQFYIKRVSGSGTISYTVDGSNYTSLGPVNSTAYVAMTGLTAGGLNPTIGFKIGTSGDSFVIDYVGKCDIDNYYPVATTSASVTVGTDTPTYSTSSTSTSVAQPTETLISYASKATTKMLAASTGCFYDVSLSGPVGVPISSGYTSNRWQYENFNGYAVMVNGNDSPIKYDGSSITSNSITGSGLTSSNLIYVNLFKHRLFFVEKNTLNVWYLATDAISGSATKLDFSTYCKLGGYMVAMGNIPKDGGDGPDDYAVFITSRGEVLVFQGTDPANANTWAIVGVYRIGAPVGQRPLMKYGADLIVICEDGFAPLSRVLPLDRVGATKATISDKIRNASATATSAYKGNFGWQGVLYPKSNWIVFNVPTVENQTQNQYVLNTLNNNWCQFIGMNANCWEVYNSNLYFATTNGFICQADVGNGDDNCSYTTNGLNSIQGDIKTSFQYFSSRARKKQFKMIRPVISSNGTPSISLAVAVDFEEKDPAPISTPAASGSAWDTSPWDTSPWASDALIRKNFITVNGNGYCAALRMRTITNGVTITLNSVDWLFESGGVM